MRLRRWLRYRQALNAKVRERNAKGYLISAAAYERMRDEARDSVM